MAQNLVDLNMPQKFISSQNTQVSMVRIFNVYYVLKIF